MNEDYDFEQNYSVLLADCILDENRDIAEIRGEASNSVLPQNCDVPESVDLGQQKHDGNTHSSVPQRLPKAKPINEIENKGTVKNDT